VPSLAAEWRFLLTEPGARKVGVCARCSRSFGGGEEGRGGLKVGDMECFNVSREGGFEGGGGTESFGVRALTGDAGREANSDSTGETPGEIEVLAELGGASTVGRTVSRYTRPVGRAVSDESTVVSP